MRIAVIDTGTNSTRLLVADVEDGMVGELRRITTVTRLGEQVNSGGKLLSAARERVDNCISDYAWQIEDMGVDRVLVLATSSVRSAEDGEEFLIDQSTSRGYDWKLLSGEEEAGLAYAGATIGAAPDEQIMMFDIGGGSTEVVTGMNSKADFIRSLDIGCVRMTERFMHSDPVEIREMKDTSIFIESILERDIEPRSWKESSTTIAVAGTATSLAAIDLGLTIYDRDRVDGHVLTAGKIKTLLQNLQPMTLADKLEIPTIGSGRADVIVAGALILERLATYFNVQEVRISERDILDGAALAAESGKI